MTVVGVASWDRVKRLDPLQAYAELHALSPLRGSISPWPDLSVVVEVEEAIGWPKLWDLALDRGPNCIHGLRNFVRIVTYPPHATSPCPLCEDKDVPRVSCHRESHE